MNGPLELAAGSVCLFLGLGYLYRPKLIERMNAILRDYVFNDAYIALERKKRGAFFLLLSFLFFYMSFTAFNH